MAEYKAPYVAIGIAICEAVGLKPNDVRSLQLNIDVETGVTLKVEMYAHKADPSNIAAVLRTYELIPTTELETPLRPAPPMACEVNNTWEVPVG
jgi:hypothetical protein